MARKEKEAQESPHARGFAEIIGISLIAAAMLLMVAQWSYDRWDVSAVRIPPNSPPHNWIGSAGAWVAFGSFRMLGAAAFVMPLLLLFFGLGYLWDHMAYLRRRWWSWIAGLVLLVCCTGLLDLYTNEKLLQNIINNERTASPGFLENLAYNLAAPSAGGMVGNILNHTIFGVFGKFGATVIFLLLYVISLYFLTNFQLGHWVRAAINRPADAEEEETFEGMTEEEKALARKAKSLEKQARKLQDELDKSKGQRTADKAAAKESREALAAGRAEDGKPGLGADLQPVPEPMIRDLSIPQAKPQPKQDPKAASEGAPEKPGENVVPAASSEDILGKGAANLKRGKKEAKEEPQITIVPAKLEPAAPKESPVEEENPFAAKPEPEAEDKEKDAALAAAAPANEAASAVSPSLPNRPKPIPKKPKKVAVASTPMIGDYQLPTMEFLQLPDTTLKPTETKEELMASAVLMKNTLAQFDIEVSIGDITKGPTITRYELHPAPGVKLEKIAALQNNISAALKAERIHVLAPIPGKSSVGVEVPNLIKTKVIMRDILESEEWQNSKARIPLALGKDVYGRPMIADLGDMPHLLIAGATGSGKSVCVNCIVASLLYRFRPDELRFVLIDPKVVEMQQYNSLPHLVVPVVTDPKKVILALRWVVNEMEKRYKIFAKVGVRNIKSFNERPRNKPLPPQEPELPLLARKERIEPNSDGFAVEVDEEIVVPREDDIVIPDKLSYIVVIIDELADLMLVAPADVEMAIARITQMARAAGIHCIVATQRPSVDVITGVIKANIPARIAFQVASRVDSRTILDAMGADKLLGKGDMLYLPPGSAKLIRAQGALITDQELTGIVDFISKQGKPSYEMEIHQQLQKPVSALDADAEGSNEDEDLIEQCIEVIRSEQKASVSLLQRRLKLGYGRAARIMDELERRGIVGPSKGAEPRDILIDLDGGGADGAGVDTGSSA
ncbi:MAG: DNA translocase FtsK [Verrucomicrobiota bacterium]